MPKEKYFFQQKKISFARKFFEKGMDASAYILLAIGEQGELFLRGMPTCYPAFGLMKKAFNVYPYNKKQVVKRETIRVNLHRLKKQGLIAKDPKKAIYCLTDEGKEFVIYIKDRYAVLKQPWDGKLRIVIFDIPEERKGRRVWLRQELVLLQYCQLQKSVYIGKSPLPKSLYQEIARQGLNGYVFILTAGEIDKKEKILKILKQTKER